MPNRAAARCNGVNPAKPIRMNGKALAQETIVNATAAAADTGDAIERDRTEEDEEFITG